jgi:hypothetical protein
MKKLLTSLFTSLILSASSLHAASDADVNIIKAESVTIEEDKITIIAEAKARITLTIADAPPDYKGAKWQGRPVALVTMKADNATFTIKRPPFVGADPGTKRTLDDVWKATIELAKVLKKGEEVGRIGFYAPDIVIKENLIHSISGSGYLYNKGN